MPKVSRIKKLQSAIEEQRTEESRYFYLLLFCIAILPYSINGILNFYAHGNSPVFWGMEAFLWIVIPVTVIFVARSKGLKLTDIGLHAELFGHRRFVLLVLLSISAGPLFQFSLAPVQELVNTAFPDQGMFSYGLVIPERGLRRAAVILYLSLTAAFVEEFYFRGLLFKACSNLSPTPARPFMILSPLIFAALHWESGLASVLNNAIVGFYMASIYAVFRNLWIVITAHFYLGFVVYINM
jgi:hypothetical protein